MGPWRTVELTDSSTQLPLFVVQFPTSKHFFLNQKHQSQYDSSPKILWAFLMKCHLNAIFTLVRTSGTFMNRTLIYDTYKHNIIFLQLFHFFFLCSTCAVRTLGVSIWSVADFGGILGLVDKMSSREVVEALES